MARALYRIHDYCVYQPVSVYMYFMLYSLSVWHLHSETNKIDKVLNCFTFSMHSHLTPWEQLKHPVRSINTEQKFEEAKIKCSRTLIHCESVCF